MDTAFGKYQENPDKDVSIRRVIRPEGFKDKRFGTCRDR